MTRPCPGPLPPKRPRYRAPAGACDTHAHIFGPYERFPLAADRQYSPPEAPVADYAQLLDTLGIERCVIVQPSSYATDNAAIADALGRLGTRSRGIAMVEPDEGDAELDRLNAQGFRGVRLTPGLRGGDPLTAVEALAPRLGRLGWHVDLMIDGPRDGAGLLPRLGALGVELVLDHFAQFTPAAGLGHPGFAALMDLLGTGRAWVKLSCADRLSPSGAPFADMAPLARALIDARPDRMLWGTDWPHVAHWDQPIPADCDLLDWTESWGIDSTTARRILVDNPAALYGFS